MSVIAVYGGAFNPPHVGHAMVVSWILKRQLANRVILVPSFAHPFSKDMRPFEERLRLVEDFANDVDPHDERVLVSAVESVLPAPNYTINQLRKLQELWGSGHKLRCVMGADNLAKRENWFGFDEIVADFDPIFANREGVVLPEGVTVNSPVFPNISSTEIRQRISDGRPADHLLTPKVRHRVLGSATLLRG